MRFSAFVVSLTVLALAAPAAPCQLVAYEGFNFTAGSNLNGQAGGTGLLGSWFTSSAMPIGTGSLTPPSPANGLTTTGNHLILPVSSPQITAIRTVNTSLTTVNADGTVWVSFVISRTAGATSGSYGGLVIGNDSGTSPSSGRLFIGDSGASSPTPDTWSLERAGGGALGVSNLSVSSFPTVLLVARIQFQSGADAVSLYVNPDPNAGPPGSVSAFLNTLDINPFNGRVTDLNVWSGGDGGYVIDEIRVGQTFASVTPVPEPAGLILALGLAAWRVRARRRTRIG